MSVTLTRDVLLELKEVSDLTHQNVNTFVGACIDNPNICLLTQYCNKGSLQVIIIIFTILERKRKDVFLIFF